MDVLSLASADRRSENVVVETIVISELKFRDIQWHVLAADAMECADNAAFEDRPEAFNRVRMHRADDVTMRGVPDLSVRIISQAAVELAFIGREQTDFVADHFADESFSGFLADAIENARDNVSFTADRANDRSFSARSPASAAMSAMFVDCFATDVAFIDLNDAAELVHVALDQSSADAVCHVPSGFERTETHVAPQLSGAHSLLAGQDQMRDLEPVAERLVCVLEHRSGDNAEPIAVWRAFLALPMPFPGREIVHGRVAATRAADALGPSTGLQIGLTGVLIPHREHLVELGRSQLMDGFWHGESPKSDFGSLPHA